MVASVPAMATEQLRAAHYAQLASLMPELVSHLSWSRRQIAAHQTAALRELLAYVRACSPWHARRTAHLDPDTVTLEDIRRLPTMTKADLMTNWDEIVTIPGASLGEAEELLRNMSDQTYVWGDNVLLASGGTGGQPGLFLYDWKAMAVNWGGMHRALSGSLARTALRSANTDRVRSAAIAAERSAHGSYVMARIFSNPANPTSRFSAWRTGDDLFEELNAIQPQVFFCYPTRVPMLAAATQAGKLRIRPQVIFFSSEHLSDACRRLARETWVGADILSCWATSEGAGTYACPLGDGFHVSEDLVILEPVDKDGNPVGPGERSAGIFLTNLFNRALPIIRYFIDDIFEMDDRPCPCGSNHRKVRQVHGRSFEFFQYEAAAVHPLALELAVLEQPAIVEYQIQQTEAGARLLYRNKGPVDVARLQTKIRDALLSYGLTVPEVRIEAVDRLERTPTGKLIRFVPLARAKAQAS